MAEDNPSTPPRTAEEFEDLIRKVGDEAMKRLGEKYAVPKENSGPPANACPYCRQNLDEGVCEHWIASLSDDRDGYDTVTPLYFGWLDYCNKSQEEMIASLDSYFEALCALCDQVVKKGPDEGKRILRAAKGLPAVEKATLREAIKILDLPDAKENYETAHDLLSGEFFRQMKEAFTDFVLRCGGKATNWEINNPPPAPSWSGTNYCAEDAKKCVMSIIQECGKATDRLDKLIHKR